VQVDLDTLPDDPAILQQMLRDVVQQHAALHAQTDKWRPLIERLLSQCGPDLGYWSGGSARCSGTVNPRKGWCHEAEAIHRRTDRLVRYGCRRLHVLLWREGWPVNHKRTYRLYAEEGLSIRSKLPRRKRAWRYRRARPGAAAPNEIWAMDFISDQLFDGRPIRILTIVDIHTREALSTHPGANFRAAQAVEILDGLVRIRGKPKSLRLDNGPEFAGRRLDHRAYLNGVEIDFSRFGKPTDNAFIEVFNARLRTAAPRPGGPAAWLATAGLPGPGRTRTSGGTGRRPGWWPGPRPTAASASCRADGWCGASSPKGHALPGVGGT
jgi:transposase InsO family protein